MKRVSVLALGILGLAACATDPAPVVVGGATSSGTVMVATPASDPIGQCQPRAPKAVVFYPDGWSARIRAAESVPNAEDELLGGSGDVTEAAFSPRPSNLVPPNYPLSAIDESRQGACEVMFDLGTDGKATNLLTACTSDMFKSAAEKSVTASTFSPKRVGGRAVEAKSVIYPMTFCIEP